MDIFFVEAGVPNANTNGFRANLDTLRNIAFANLNANALDFLEGLVHYMKSKAGWSTSKVVTPTNYPNNRPGPGGNRSGGGAGNNGGGRIGAGIPPVVGDE